MKHTQGPWTLQDMAYPDIESVNGRMIVVFDTDTPNDAETMANARLMAASPEMYEMLKLIHQEYALSGMSKEVGELIKRIEGEQS